MPDILKIASSLIISGVPISAENHPSSLSPRSRFPAAGSKNCISEVYFMNIDAQVSDYNLYLMDISNIRSLDGSLPSEGLNEFLK